jgi:acetyl esterase/lipase
MDAGHPALIHLPERYRPPDGRRVWIEGMHPASIRVFERYVPEPWSIEGFGCAQLIHGRGLKSFKWALRAIEGHAVRDRLKLSYGGHPDQVAWLQLPAQPDTFRAPVVVLVHGGFWGDVVSADHMLPIANFLSARGIPSLNIEYRRGGRFDWRDSTADVVAGIVALGRLPQAIGASPRIVVIGHSSGAQLAHSALSHGSNAIAGCGIRICGLVSLAGILDIALACQQQLGNSAVQQAFAKTIREGGLAMCSPVLQCIATDVLVVHGNKDRDVPLVQSREYVERSQARGRSAALQVTEQIDHMDLIKPNLPHWESIIEWIWSRQSVCGADGQMVLAR